MGGLFDIDGPLFSALTDIMVLVVLNLLTLLCSIPIFTAGAAFSALHYTVIKMKKGKAGLYKMFLREFKNNLKTMTASWLILLFFALFLLFDYWILFKLDAKTAVVKGMFFFVYLAMFLWIAIFVWIFPYGACFVNSTKNNFRNAFLLAVGKIPRTLIMMALNLVIPLVLVFSMNLIPLFIAFGFSMPAYLSSFAYDNVLGPMVKKAKIAAGLSIDDDEDWKNPDENDPSEKNPCVKNSNDKEADVKDSNVKNSKEKESDRKNLSEKEFK